MVFHGISIISAPHNMGVDTLFGQLSSLLTEIWPTNEFSVMAALICIQIVRGTFCQLVNIANRFLRIFSHLETLIRFIFPGGAGYPYLPTQLPPPHCVLPMYAPVSVCLIGDFGPICVGLRF